MSLCARNICLKIVVSPVRVRVSHPWKPAKPGFCKWGRRTPNRLRSSSGPFGAFQRPPDEQCGCRDAHRASSSEDRRTGSGKLGPRRPIDLLGMDACLMSNRPAVPAATASGYRRREKARVRVASRASHGDCSPTTRRRPPRAAHAAAGSARRAAPAPTACSPRQPAAARPAGRPMPPRNRTPARRGRPART
jgi:hypothetical protein